MYFSAKHIDIKSSQDYAEFYNFESKKGIIICDGIGEYEHSGEVSKIVVDNYIEQIKNKDFNINDFVKSIPPKLNDRGITGGTTLITAEIIKQQLIFNYLGNGGIIHLKGDFYINPVSSVPYRYSELMNPDITPSGALNKHISHNSGEQELSITSLMVFSNSVAGDIYLLFSDGISSLEEHVIVEDDSRNLWRNESIAVKVILEELHNFILKNKNNNQFNDSLIAFNDDILKKLSEQNLLEDDASLGIIVTEKVLQFYRETND